ncbi:MAG: prepilin-type N-terminal cleavage/methylation domain-containing protein [Lachnospiraceae bacterium]|nr:prepilin-type N-terminal cleavage/methylation domain-containing protein [Lachnospiraceae bacterium]
MRKMNNKGVSMVEILIALAIFTVLMMPIVSGIITSMRKTTDAKTLQYRNEYVENVVEYVKQDSIENIVSGDYFSSIGSYTGSSTPVIGSVEFYKDPGDASYDASLENMKKIADDMGWSFSTGNTDVSSIDMNTLETKYFPYEVYTLGGKVKLGTEHETYSYKVQISNKYYAQKEQVAMDNGDVYINPNNLALGVVEDIDHTKVALINGTIANYDASVSNAFLTKKVEVLKEKLPDVYEQYTQQQGSVELFPYDTATRTITVKVSGAPDTGYTVRCILRYHDNCETNSTVASALRDYYIEYVPFEYTYPVDTTTGVATLPNIYLMYNVCLYNGMFSADDYIVMDTTELDDKTTVKCFIVETASTYSDDIVSANNDLGTVDGSGNIVTPTLYNDNTQTSSTRSQVRIHLAAKKGSKLKNVHVYHNFDIDDVGSTILNTGSNKKSHQVFFHSYHAKAGGLFNSAFSAVDYVPLVTYSSGHNVDAANSVADFTSLDGAEEESRGLYEIKVWMVEGDDLDAVDMTADPIMTATKGGDES